MPGISIALATYNGSRYLRQQLDSLEQQTHKPVELVVCDDRSTDDTVEVLRAFAVTASFPVHIHVNAERLGWRGNFITASGRCTGDLIAFCDQDDLWYPHKLASMVAVFDDPTVLLAYHNADLIDEEGTPYDTLLPVEDAPRRIPTLSRPTPWSNPLGLTLVFRSSLAHYNDLWPETVDLAASGHPAAHDQWFYFLGTNLGTVVSLPDRLLGYRQHRDNSVGWSHETTADRSTPSATRVMANADRILEMLRPFCRVLAKASRREGPFTGAFERAYKKNLELVDRLERRRRLYLATSLAKRLQLVWSLITRGSYGQRRDWGFGGRAFVEDVTAGIFGRHRFDATDRPAPPR